MNEKYIIDRDDTVTWFLWEEHKNSDRTITRRVIKIGDLKTCTDYLLEIEGGKPSTEN